MYMEVLIYKNLILDKINYPIILKVLALINYIIKIIHKIHNIINITNKIIIENLLDQEVVIDLMMEDLVEV